MGYTAAYVSKLEKGSCAASMAVLEKLSNALEIPVAHLLASPGTLGREHGEVALVPVLNEPRLTKLVAPTGASNPPTVQAGISWALCIRARNSFALYLPDNSMGPEFSKGDLVVFSLTCKLADGDACLVDTGKGRVLFRTVLAVGKGRWRLQASNPEYQPVMVSAGKQVKMWPAVGHWRSLGGKRPR